MSANKTLTKNSITFHDFDPDATTATDVAWVDMRDFSGLTVAYYKTVGSDSLSAFTIQGSASANGSSDPDAVGDYVFFEIDAHDIAQALDGARYVSAQLTVDTATDEAVVVYIRTGARFADEDVTADTVA